MFLTMISPYLKILHSKCIWRIHVTTECQLNGVTCDVTEYTVRSFRMYVVVICDNILMTNFKYFLHEMRVYFGKTWCVGRCVWCVMPFGFNLSNTLHI